MADFWHGLGHMLRYALRYTVHPRGESPQNAGCQDLLQLHLSELQRPVLQDLPGSGRCINLYMKIMFEQILGKNKGRPMKKQEKSEVTSLPPQPGPDAQLQQALHHDLARQRARQRRALAGEQQRERDKDHRALVARPLLRRRTGEP